MSRMQRVAYILFLLVLVEVGSRLFWQMSNHTWGMAVPQQLGQIDPQLGWSLKPGATASSKATGTPVRYTINSLGFRGPETPLEKPAGVFRIVVLGDSHTFGFGIPLEQHFTTILQGYFKNVEVINLGVCGYGVDQMLLRLNRDGWPLKPDLVICDLPHFEDFRHMQDTLWGVGKPRFLLRDGELQLTNSPVGNNSWTTVAALEADRFLADWCRTYEILRNTVYAWYMRPKPPVGPVPALDPKILADTLNVGWSIISKMEAECQEHKVPFVLVTSLGELAKECYTHGTPMAYMGFALHNQQLVLTHDPMHHPNEAANGIIGWELSKYLKIKKLVPEDLWLMPLWTGVEASPR